MKKSNFVEVWNYSDTPSAEVGKYTLETNGIEAEVFGGNVDTMYMTAMGGISLMVKREDFEAAKKILQSESEALSETAEVGKEISRGSVFCSKCHSQDIRVKKIRHASSNSFFKKWMISLFGYDQVFSCRECKNIWKQ